MVIKKLVYEDRKYTLSYFYDQLSNDFPNEAFRQECIHKVPKFGNDFDEVDGIAANIIDYSCDVLDELESKYNLVFYAQPFTYLWMVDHGRVTAATPDGRKKGEIIAYSVSPMQGRDFNGFTALLNSISKLPTKRCAGTTSAIVEVDPKLFTDGNISRFADILDSAAKKGLCNVQFNTIDAETLIDAQKYPEKYSNLAVRVSGFSQKFVLLDKKLQDHIIGRTKHKCL
jgi:formate C-acetyltransferase